MHSPDKRPIIRDFPRSDPGFEVRGGANGFEHLKTGVCVCVIIKYTYFIQGKPYGYTVIPLCLVTEYNT